MSHSVVLVCLRPGADIVGEHFSFSNAVQTALDAALAPFDENAETEPYKDYAEGEPSEYWAVKELRKEGRLPQDGDAALTWEQVCAAYTAQWPPSEGGERYLTDEHGMYSMSTYPPNKHNGRGALIGGARWDWWLLGGRWTGYFQVKDEHVGSELLAGGRPGTFNEANRDHRKTDAAPKGLIDFAAMRAEKADEAATTWFAFDKIVKQYPETQSWAAFRARVEAGELDIDQARSDYREQPGVQALRLLESDFRWYEDPYKELCVPRADYVADAERAAVPGWSLLTLDGEWHERGKMGWWGVSDATGDSTAQYEDWANGYLESLPDDVIIAAVDVHI